MGVVERGAGEYFGGGGRILGGGGRIFFGAVCVLRKYAKKGVA